MLCERCGKNPATVYYKEIINGKVREMHICAKCAAQLGLQVMPGFTGAADFGLQSLLGGLFTQMMPQTQAGEKRCRFCGCSLSEVARNGQVGCPHCYEEFYDQLLPTIERIHGKTRHVGKVPRSASGGLRLRREEEDLKRQLSEAVAAQAYEKAAVLRDKLRALEGKGAFHSRAAGSDRKGPDGAQAGGTPGGKPSGDAPSGGLQPGETPPGDAPRDGGSGGPSGDRPGGSGRKGPAGGPRNGKDEAQ